MLIYMDQEPMSFQGIFDVQQHSSNHLSDDLKSHNPQGETLAMAA